MYTSPLTYPPPPVFRIIMTPKNNKVCFLSTRQFTQLFFEKFLHNFVTLNSSKEGMKYVLDAVLSISMRVHVNHYMLKELRKKFGRKDVENLNKPCL